MLPFPFKKFYEMCLQLSKLGLFNIKEIYSMSYVNFQMTSHTDTIPDIIETGSSDTSDNGSMQLLSQLFYFFANIIDMS